MINSSVNPASASGSQALIKAQIDSSDTGNSVGKLFERRLFSLSTTSEPGNHQGIPRLNATVSNKNNRMYSNKVIGKPLEKREKVTLSALNQLAAGCSAMAGSAWVRGVSLYNPANLTMSLMQQVPALVATVCPDCPGLISAAWSAASWGQAYGWANSIFTAMATGNIAAVAATAALCGASYASHHVSRDSVSQLCAQLPASVREYGEPWLQAATKVALAGALKAAGTVGWTERGSNDRFIVPEHEASHPSTEADLPPLVFDNRWYNHSAPHYATGIAMAMNTTENLQVRCSENSLPDFASSPDRPALYAPTVVSLQTVALPQTRTVILPANHTDHGQASPMPADAVPVSNPEGQGAVVDFLQLPLAEAGLIRSFTREQQKYHLHQAARQHQALPKQCPDLAGAVPGSNNGTVYPSESHTSGWVASPGNQIFHYQLFSATPGSPLVTDTEGKQIPAPGFLRLAQTIQNGIKEHAVTDKTLPPNVVANQLPIASAHLSPPKIQNRLDPEVLATEVKNSTMLVLKPCNAKTGQPETSVLVLSADRAGRGVTINMGTDGFLEDRSLRARRQALPDNGEIRLAPECSTEGSGYISGRLEVFVEGRWGTVDDDFEGSTNHDNARVACTQLGYPGSISSQIPLPSRCPNAPVDGMLENLNCTGNENKILDCPHQLTVANRWFHLDDIAIECQLFELSINGCVTESGSVLGRLRVFHNGTMGSVCKRGVGNGDAICKSLGFPGGVIKNTTGSCSAVTGPIHWAGLSCNGTEASPHDCWHNEQTMGCNHEDDLVLSCGPVVRLAQCQTESSGSVGGRLEVFEKGRWGTVCHSTFSDAEARVVCTQLGYPGVISREIPLDQTCPEAPPSPVQRKNVHCTEKEKNFLDCPHEKWIFNFCRHDSLIKDVALECQLFELSTKDCDAEPGSVLGRLRVFHNGTMGSVCNRGVSDGDAICNSLGFPGGVIKNTTGSCTNSTEPIHWAGLSCNGTETSPRDCWHNEQTMGCSHEDDVVLSCGPLVRLAQCQTAEPGSVAGRLEVFVDGQWGTITDRYFGSANARVACTQLGYPDVISRKIPVAPTCPEAPMRVLLDNLRCTGNEKKILDCPHNMVAHANHFFRQPKIAAVECQLFELSTNDCNVNPGSVLGILRVFHNGTLGSVCNRGADNGDTICKSLGYPGGVIKNITGLCTPGTGLIHWAGLSCNGTEASPHGCLHNEQTEGCTHEDDLVLSCSPVVHLAQCQPERPGSVAGRLEVFVHGQWGALCGNHFNVADARVACTQLGYSGTNASRIPVAPSCLKASRPIRLDNLHCTGNEKNLLDCFSGKVGVRDCEHDDEIAVRCQMPAISTIQTPKIQTPTIQIQTTLTNQKATRSKLSSGIGWTIGGLAMAATVVSGVVFVGRSVYKNAKKPAQDNEDPATGRFIRKSGITTITKPWGLSRTISTQLLVGDESASSRAQKIDQMEMVVFKEVREEEASIQESVRE